MILPSFKKLLEKEYDKAGRGSLDSAVDDFAVAVIQKVKTLGVGVVILHALLTRLIRNNLAAVLLNQLAGLDVNPRTQTKATLVHCVKNFQLVNIFAPLNSLIAALLAQITRLAAFDERAPVDAVVQATHLFRILGYAAMTLLHILAPPLAFNVNI